MHAEQLRRTVSHFLQVLENAKMVSQVCSQNDVSNQIQHTLVVLKNINNSFSLHLLYSKSLIMRKCQIFLSYLSGELLKDVAAKSVQNGDGLGKVMSLSWPKTWMSAFSKCCFWRNVDSYATSNITLHASSCLITETKELCVLVLATRCHTSTKQQQLVAHTSSSTQKQQTNIRKFYRVQT